MRSSGQDILLPSVGNSRNPSSRNQQSILVEVNSRDRNYTQFPSANPFYCRFARPLKDVRSVELINGTIPATPYQIHQANNRFVFTENGEKHTLTLIPGFYTTTSFLLHLGELLRGINEKYSVFVSSANKLCFSSSGDVPSVFGISFKMDEYDTKDGSLQKTFTPALIMGFESKEYISQGGIIESPNFFDLYATSNRLYLFVDFENKNSLSCIERSVGRRSPFAIIYLDSQTNGYKYMNKETITPVLFSLPQPMSRLQGLSIEFRDEFYNLIQFGGKDFTLLLEVIVLE